MTYVTSSTTKSDRYDPRSASDTKPLIIFKNIRLRRGSSWKRRAHRSRKKDREHDDSAKNSSDSTKRYGQSRVGSTLSVSICVLSEISAPLFANELLSGAAEIASATCRWSAGSWGGSRKAGILAVHRLRVTIDLTCGGCCIHGRRREGHRVRNLTALSEQFGSKRRAIE